jgi:PmbA protein
MSDADRELQTRAAEAVALAKKAGAQDAAATTTWQREVDFQVRDGALEQVSDSTSRSLILRLFVDGRYGRHDTTDLRPDRVQRFVGDAVAQTRALAADPHRRLPDPALTRGAPALTLADPAVAALDRDRRLAWARAMNERAAGKDGVVSATSNVTDRVSVVAGAASNGFAGLYRSTSVSLFTEVTLAEGDKRPEEYQYAAARGVAGLPDAAGIADEALARTRARLGAVKGPTRRTHMLVEARSATQLVNRLLGPATAAAVQQGRSFWKDRLGTKVVSPKLSIVDDATLAGGLASRPFDDEGIAARRLPLVEAGVFTSLYADTYYASKLGSSVTSGQPSNRVVTPGTRSRNDLLAAAKGGVLVTAWLGGNMDATTGDFSLGVRGHLIEGGTVGAPVGEMNVTGNIVDLFAHLVDLGNDVWPYSSVRTPSLLFEGVQFAGA